MFVPAKVLASAAVLGCALPVYAEESRILTLGFAEVDSGVENTIPVDRHEVLLLDVSSSMDVADIEASLRGVVGHYSSDKAMADYMAGICTANTVVFYGSTPYVMDTQVICGREDLQVFAATLLNVDLSAVRKEVGGNTSLTNAMQAAVRVFEGEETQGIDAGMHSVIAIGDELGGSSNDLREISINLTARFEATVSAISINNAGLAGQFRNLVSTSEQDARLYYIRAGVTEAAYDSEQVQEMLQRILSLNQG